MVKIRGTITTSMTDRDRVRDCELESGTMWILELMIERTVTWTDGRPFGTLDRNP
jgi:hypothetical protein